MTVRERVFGNTGVTLPVVGQGTWMMENDPDASIEALRHGLELGLTLVDTAEMYGSGRVEEIVGRALAGRRDEVYLVSKVLPSNASRRGTQDACERSLRRLGTDRLDLYLLHWAGDHPLEDTVAAFDELVEAGKIRAWGVSNFDAEETAACMALSRTAPPATNQVLYHLMERSIEHEVLPYCVAHDVALMAYSPFGQGRFPEVGSPGRQVLDDIASAHGVSPYTVALRFLADGEGVFTFPKSSRKDHVEANAAALGLSLSPDERSAVEAAFPRGPRRSGVPML